MTEYGRIHTDGSRSGGQPTQSDCEVAASIRSALYRACSNMPNYPKGIVEPFVAAHHRHGYDQGYYDGCTRQLTQSDALRIKLLEDALVAVVEATRAYLPPDGIDAKECLSRILEATDNSTINPVIFEIEDRAALQEK